MPVDAQTVTLAESITPSEICGAQHPLYKKVLCRKGHACDGAPHSGPVRRGQWADWKGTRRSARSIKAQEAQKAESALQRKAAKSYVRTLVAARAKPRPPLSTFQSMVNDLTAIAAKRQKKEDEARAARTIRTIAQKNRRSGMRKTARRNFLDRVVSPFSLCHWCGITILWRTKIPEEWTFKYDGPPGTQIARITRGSQKIEEVYRLATIDHVESLASGGGNHPFNLVAACARCNNDRSKSQ